MVLPIASMVLMMPVAMYITGGGDVMAGSGSVSVLWAVLAGLAVASVLSLGQKLLSIEELGTIGVKGAGGLTGMALVLLLALTLGAVTRELGTGDSWRGSSGIGCRCSCSCR